VKANADIGAATADRKIEHNVICYVPSIFLSALNTMLFEFESILRLDKKDHSILEYLLLIIQ